jgi:hypothetical protein
MVRRWCDQATRANKVSRACELHAHLAYIFGNIPSSEFTVDNITQLVASNIFLTTRYVYDLAAENGAMYGRTEPERRGLESGLGIPDTEMFDLFQSRRSLILDFLDGDQERANETLEGVIKIITMGDEVRLLAAYDADLFISVRTCISNVACHGTIH